MSPASQSMYFVLMYARTRPLVICISSAAADNTVSSGTQETTSEQESMTHNTSGDTGAFSFYYLAFRRGGEIDRRIGQTFAMLCSHDGDPIFQELGEALYCWFLSVVKTAAKENGII